MVKSYRASRTSPSVFMLTQSVMQRYGDGAKRSVGCICAALLEGSIEWRAVGFT